MGCQIDCLIAGLFDGCNNAGKAAKTQPVFRSQLKAHSPQLFR